MRRLVWLLLIVPVALLVVLTKALWLLSAGLLWVALDLDAWANRKE